MNTAAIGTTFTILGSLAYAAGQGAAPRPQPAGAVTRSPVHEDVAVSQRHQDTTMAALAGGGESCTIGEPLNWFTQVHPLHDCGELIWGGFSMTNTSDVVSGTESVDADGDGVTDRLVLLGDWLIGGNTTLGRSWAVTYGEAATGIQDDGFQPPLLGEHALFKVVHSLTGGVVTTTLHPVLSRSVVLQALCAVTTPCDGSIHYAQFTPSDFTDMDGDGDLDLILAITLRTPKYEYFTYRVWIENTVKAGSPLAADINRDGVVDGKDLASVLAAWTP
jgi:hypothetical protein